MATKRNENINPNLVGNQVPEGGYTEKYTGGNAALDEGLSYWGNEYNKAKESGDAMGMQNANDNANMLRNQHGYAAEYATNDIQSVANANPEKNRGGLGSSSSGGSGGSSGSGGFSYGNAPSYVNRYSNDIAELSHLILNREPFTYDPEKDDTYLQYEKSYTRSGQRAMEDTLGQVSARTGGYASSYAGAAAQQAYDTYMSALADKIPELKQLAYSMYQDDLANQRANLSMLMALEEGDYAKYLDTLGQYNTDRNFYYQVGRDTVLDNRYNTEWQHQLDREQLEDSRYDTEWQHQLDREEIEDQRYEDETEYERQQDSLDRAWQEDQAAFQNAMTRWTVLGVADAEVARVLGIPVGTRTTDWQYQQAQMRAMSI